MVYFYIQVELGHFRGFALIESVLQQHDSSRILKLYDFESQV